MAGGWIAGSSWRRNLQNFTARSYRFARAIHVFHLLRGSSRYPGPAGMADPARKHRWSASDQLTCRAAAPKTCRQFRPFSAETRHSGRDSMGDVFVCDAVRTPIGRFGGSLAKVRADDLAAAPIKT